MKLRNLQKKIVFAKFNVNQRKYCNFMVLFGAILNGATVILGGLLGSILKKRLTESMGNTIMCILSLCLLYIGISGSLKGKILLLEILSLALGCFLGELLCLEKYLYKFGCFFQNKMRYLRNGESLSEGFISCTLMTCIGAMAIVGAVESGITGNHTTLVAKALIDGVAALIMGSTLGVGVAFSGGIVFLYEAILTICARIITPILNEGITSEICCVGSILLIGVALNMLKITKIHIVNCVPGLILMPVLYWLFYVH